MKKLLALTLLASSTFTQAESLVDYKEYTWDNTASIQFTCSSEGGINMGIVNERMKTLNHSANPYHPENVKIRYTNDDLYGQPDAELDAIWSDYYNMYVVKGVTEEMVDKMAVPGLLFKLNFGYSNTTEYSFTTMLIDMYSDTAESCK